MHKTWYQGSLLPLMYVTLQKYSVPFTQCWVFE
jgi:hypothetical protein